MARITINETVLDDIADAIRDKLDTETQYAPQAMAAAISSIESPNLMTGNIIANGTYIPSGEKNGFSSVTVNVPNSYAQSDEGKVVSNGSLISQISTTKTSNGTYDTTTNNEVVVNVIPTLQEKTVTENGNVTPDSGYDGLSKVVVNVSGGGTVYPFIESQDRTYIDTGVAGNTIYGIEIEFTPVTPAENYQVYAECSNNVFTIASMAISAGVTSGYIRCGNVDFGVVTYQKGAINKVVCSGGTVTLNGTQLSGSYLGAINTNSTTLRLLGNSTKSHSRLYNCKLYDSNGNVMHNYEPRVDSNFIACLYDTITNTYLYGQSNLLTYGVYLPS